MSLSSMWNDQPDQLADKQIQQIISFAGEGKLADDSATSKEFRDFLQLVTSDFLNKYVNECLEEKFANSDFALQDIVNEIGRRLGFTVENGRYHGKKNDIGHDGLWILNNESSLILEVKTTDAYRIDLDRIAEYRTKLVEGKRVSEKASSILIVVGRQDTGDLEAQIRGSRHAWDIRLISAEALLRLVELKENLDDPTVSTRISGILIPREYTRVDAIIDLVFQLRKTP